jgi:3-hydroxybutyryl-CoA dehydrogenase
MGAGIAQLGVQAGFETVLSDPDPAQLEKGVAYVRKWIGQEPATGDVDGCELIIEAAPERLELKREIFASLPEDAVLATNTSSILVTSIAGAAKRPENVVGMHFFNPPALMKLVEVIPAEQSSPDAVRVAMEAAESMGKVAIQVMDGPGFLVNRCGRPFYSEALQLLKERVATHAEIDRVMRTAGFRMGPFELMDLVGIDVGFEVAKSFDAQAFGAEMRWKPSPLQARKVAAGHLGRKSGKGWYDYPPGPPKEPEPLEMPEVLDRIVAQLVNEAAFALGEGIGSRDDIDTGVKLGLNHPRGPLEWDLERAVEVLDSLEGERYRVAPWLR